MSGCTSGDAGCGMDSRYILVVACVRGAVLRRDASLSAHSARVRQRRPMHGSHLGDGDHHGCHAVGVPAQDHGVPVQVPVAMPDVRVAAGRVELSGGRPPSTIQPPLALQAHARHTERHAVRHDPAHSGPAPLHRQFGGIAFPMLPCPSAVLGGGASWHT
jgi:hypothetical protein